MNFLICDDHPIICFGIKQLITNEFSYCEINTVASGTECINALKNGTVDVLFLDLKIPEKNGIKVINYCIKHKLNIKIIVVSAYFNSDLFEFFKKNNIHGFIPKEIVLNKLNDVLKDVLRGNKSFIDFNGNPIDYRNYEDCFLFEKLNDLTAYETKIIYYISKQYSTKEIALTMNLSEKTVENYRSNIGRKIMLEGKSKSLHYWVNENIEAISLFLDF